MARKTHSHAATDSLPELSIVIPVFNEASIIDRLVTELNSLSTQLPTSTEIIWVNDGSVDETAKFLKKAKLSWSFKILSLSRNFGHQAALYVGLKAARGHYVVTMDGDLQHPPTLIPEMLKLHQQGYDIVLTERIDDHQSSLLKKMLSSWFYVLLNIVSDTKITVKSSDFRSMNRQSVSALLSLPEHRKFLRGMVSWLGFKTIIVPFQAKPRVGGQSKYTWFKMWKLAFHGITSFSAFPLQLASIFSLILFLLAFLYAIYVLYVRLIVGDVVSGWASVTFVLLVVGGCLSLFIGLLGVYLAAIYEEIKARPVALIAESFEKTGK